MIFRFCVPSSKRLKDPADLNETSMRLRFFTCALIVATAAAPWTAPPAFAQKLEKLVIGYPAPVASLGIIDVMRKGGLFRKSGLDVDLVYIQGSPILTAAMV